MYVQNNGTGGVTIGANGNVGSGIVATFNTGAVNITGTLTATSKSFLIDHPSKSGYKLQYGSLEGPENGVYVRGKVSGTNMIELPDYWMDLIDAGTITVNLTSCTEQSVWVKTVSNSIIVTGGSMEYYFVVFAERKDIDKLTVEYPDGDQI